MNKSRLKQEVVISKLQAATIKGRENGQFTNSHVSLKLVVFVLSAVETKHENMKPTIEFASTVNKLPLARVWYAISLNTGSRT